MTTTRVRRARYALPAAAMSLALLLTACGSDDDDATGPGPGDQPSPTTSDVLGPVNKATGSKVTLGFISTGVTPAQDTTGDIKAGEAAARYINEHLGGIGGHEIELKVCETGNDPARATDCANQMVAAKVPAVLAGSAVNSTDQLVKVFAAAKLPFVAAAIPAQSALQTPGTFVMANSLYAFGAPASYAKEKGYKHVALIAYGAPSVLGPAENPGRSFYTNVGAVLDIVNVPVGTADMSAQVQTEEGKKPDLYHVIGDPNFCLSAIKAIKGLGVKTEITIIPNCISATNAASIPGGFAGLKTFGTAVLQGQEFEQYKAAMKLVTDLPPDARSVGGWQGVLGFKRAMEASKVTDLTTSSVMTGMQTMPATPFPMGNGKTFQCDGKQTKVAPNICSTFSVIATADKDGNLSDYVALAGDGIY
jgi:branched-chain amino acid transport system substrate-binding protein